MSVKVDGMYASRQAAKMANDVCAELRAVNGSTDFDDWTVDLCFRTYVAGGFLADDVAGTGIRPTMVGRVQNWFIISLEVPPDFGNRNECAAWISRALDEAADLTRSHLPTRNKATRLSASPRNSSSCARSGTPIV